ncbi:MAG: glutaredoxin domain-containing protein, partial [Pseudomonadota bacterium]
MSAAVAADHLPTASATGAAEAANRPIKITIYRWAGRWGPFRVKIPCGECTLTGDIVRDVVETELAGVPVEIETLDWLSNWWKVVMKGGWHAPIVLVEGKIISQGAALNRGVLAEEVIKVHVAQSELAGNHVFGKKNCGHCDRAKAALDAAGIAYTYHDVVKNPRAVYEMVPRAKKHIGHKTPVTTPQIWLDGKYVGGADQLEAHLG